MILSRGVIPVYRNDTSALHIPQQCTPVHSRPPNRSEKNREHDKHYNDDKES